MKKLMIAAAAAVLTAGAFAETTIPRVYDFKATVKHTYLKEKSLSSALKIDKAYVERGSKVYIKYTKSSKLKGYLIQDVQGYCTNGTITCQDAQPGNRCFLVVKNLNAEKATKDDRDYRVARIIPGVLDVKWYNNQLKEGLKSLPAQGYLYLGGEIAVNTNTFEDGVCTQTNGLAGTSFKYFEDFGGALDGYAPRTFAEWVRNANELKGPARQSLVGIDDYFFTSCYLFGKYNQPSWWSETDIVEEFADCWMNCAGFGKVSFDRGWTSHCCGRGGTQPGAYLPDTLSGSMKAGMFLCTENGEDAGHSLLLARTGLLEDQLFDEEVANAYWENVKDKEGNIVRKAVDSAFTTDEKGKVIYNEFVSYFRNTYYDISRVCADIWADGTLDLRTTDVGTGSWSLKYTTKSWPKLQKFQQQWSATFPAGYQAVAGRWLPTSLLNAVCGAALALETTTTDQDLYGNVLTGDALMNKDFFNAYFCEIEKAPAPTPAN